MERKGGISGEWNDRKRRKGRREHTGRLEYLSTGRSRGKGRKREKKITIQSGSDEAKRDGERERERKNGSGDTFARLSSNSIRDE